MLRAADASIGDDDGRIGTVLRTDVGHLADLPPPPPPAPAYDLILVDSTAWLAGESPQPTEGGEPREQREGRRR